MAKSELLRPLQVERLKKPGLYLDGKGLYLRISPTGARSWVWRYMLRGQPREMGLGAADLVSLTEAREQLQRWRKVRATGADPIEVRRQERVQKEAERARAAAAGVTFREVAESLIKAKSPEWRSGKHRSQWAQTLEKFVYPTLGPLPPAEIDTALVLQVLEPIWTRMPETAARLRSRIKAILDAAAVRIPMPPNPARWTDHLQRVLPRHAKIQKIAHHAALPYERAGELMAAVRQDTSLRARCLELLILTATRSGEALGCAWPEIDFGSAIWTIEASRMKGGKAHRIPLSKPAIVLLEARKRSADANGEPGPLVFPGKKPGAQLGHNAMYTLLSDLGFGDVTVHGMRSMFRTWAGEETSFPTDLAEAALAHRLYNDVEGAYARGDLLERRRKLMESWGAYVATVRRPADVLPMKRTARGGTA